MVIEFPDILKEGYPIGTTYQDYLDGLWIPVKKTMSAFINANPTATAKEWIEMELTPAPPEPTLSELKEQAANQVDSMATSRLNELYPPHELIAQAYSTKIDELEQGLYFDGFEAAKSAINAVLTVAIDDINTASDATSINAVVDTFYNQIYSLS